MLLRHTRGPLAYGYSRNCFLCKIKQYLLWIKNKMVTEFSAINYALVIEIHEKMGNF